MKELRRDLDLTDAVSVGLGAIIGAGLFVVTGLLIVFAVTLLGSLEAVVSTPIL